MPIYVWGLGLRNYRGIGPHMQFMGPFREFNFFIGANNAGKSTVLNFLSRYLPIEVGRHGRKTNVEPLERHDGGTRGAVEMALGFPVDEFVERSLASLRREGVRDVFDAAVKNIAEKISSNGMIWLKSEVPYGETLEYVSDVSVDVLRGSTHDWMWRDLWTALTSREGGSLSDHWIPQTLVALRQAQITSTPAVRLIPAIREIGPKSENFEDYSGRGLIDRLAQIQSPDHDRRAERQVFDRINAFLKSVTGHEEAEIEVPHHRDHLLVHMDERVLPLSSLGTGIQEVIMIAAFCTLSEEQIVCIEEPELHLHPVLQRKLVRYLQENTSNQYFIATHSPSFIDTPEAAIFHVFQEDGQTKVSESVLRSERYAICEDLGSKASDILQSNAVVWVEGPSDRIYVKHWLDAMAPDLVEGIHYTIMFYGGRLLSHLSANDEEVREFISLKNLNRNVAILIDSDKTDAASPINSTNSRVCKEIEQGSGVSWVTAGREIENYVRHDLLQEAVAQAYKASYAEPADGGQFSHSLWFKRRKTSGSGADEVVLEKEVDKVKVARLVCEREAELDILDLRDRLGELVTLIRAANA